MVQVGDRVKILGDDPWKNYYGKVINMLRDGGRTLAVVMIDGTGYSTRVPLERCVRVSLRRGI